MKCKKFVFWIVTIGVLLRFCVFLIYSPWADDWQSRYLGADPKGYWVLAHNLLSHGTFSMSDEAPFVPESIRAPGYPLFLAAHQSLFGERAWPVCIVQVLLSLLIPLWVYRIGQAYFHETAARIAAVLAAVDLYVIEFSCLLWSDYQLTLIGTAILFLVGVLLKSIHEQASRRWTALGLGLGALAGLATLTKPVAQYLLCMVLGFIFVAGIWKLRFREFPYRVIVFAVLGWLLLVGPWLCRNEIVFHKYKVAVARGGYLLFGTAAATLAQTEGISIYEAKARLKLEYGNSLTIADDDRYFEAGMKIIKQHPFDAMIANGKGMFRMFRRIDGILWKESDEPPGGKPKPPGYLHTLRNEGVGSMVRAIHDRGGAINVIFFFLHLSLLVILYGGIILSLAGFPSLSAEAKLFYVFLLLWAFYYNFLPGYDGGLRYRLPIHPVFSILAGHGIAHWLGRWSTRNQGGSVEPQAMPAASEAS